MTQAISLALSPEWPEDVFQAIANNDEEAKYLFERHKAEVAMNAANARESRG